MKRHRLRGARTSEDARLRIAHVLTSLAVGGAERVVQQLATAQVRAGHEVMVVSLEEPPDGPLGAELRAAGVVVVRVPKAAGIDLTLTWRILRVLRRVCAQVVHTHNPLPLIYGAPAGRALGARVIHTKHGPHLDRARRIWLRRIGAMCTHVFVAVSDATARAARDLREAPPGRLRVVENGAELDRFADAAARRRAVRESWGVREQDLVIGTVGRMVPVKNHPLLVHAAAPLLGGGCRLVIAGGGPELQPTRALVEALGLSRAVLFLGNVGDVPAVMAALDVFALSSDTEGLPLALVEAMASGLPAVATAVGGVPSVVAHDVTGLLVPPGDEAALRDALAALLADPARRERLGRAARAEAEGRFCSRRMAADYERLYRGEGCRATGWWS